MIYLDTSAMAKLVVKAPESAALTSWLNDRSDVPLTTSLLSRTELLRTARRHGRAATSQAENLLAECTLIPVDIIMIDTAAALEPLTLRTLDAFHCAAALSLGSDLTAFVSYDVRQLAAAESAGLPVAAPGATAP